MADYLLYWKEYWEDPMLDSAASMIYWHTGKQGFWNEVRKGDTFWIVSSGGPEAQSEWRLLRKMIVDAKSHSNQIDRPYRFEASEQNVHSFSLDQPDFSPMIRNLEFASGRRIVGTGRRIGNAIQLPRLLNPADRNLLDEYLTSVLGRTGVKPARSGFSGAEIILCIYAAIYDANDYGGLKMVQSVANRSIASIRLKVHNIVAMLDEVGHDRNPNNSALTGLPTGRQGRRTNWDKVEEYLDVPRAAFLRECLAIIQDCDLQNTESVSLARRYVEGSMKQIVVNAYERDPRARRACIEHHGMRCAICRFDFGEFYGPEAEGFIHVHHIKPLNEIGKRYEVDPIKDLLPLCPNCHAFIHLGRETRDVEQVRVSINAKGRKQREQFEDEIDLKAYRDRQDEDRVKFNDVLESAKLAETARENQSQ